MDDLLSIKEIKVKQIIIIFLLIFINSAAFSHSQLTEILPEDKVTYNEVPPQIEMKFKSEVKLVKIDLIRVDIKEKIKLDSNLLKISLIIILYQCLNWMQGYIGLNGVH